MLIDIIIDGITDCIIDTKTGKKVNTTYKKLEQRITKAEAEFLLSSGWSFDWSLPQRDGFDIYQLFTVEDYELQGMIAVKHDKKELFTHVEIAEANPDNVGCDGKYIGTGANLFAVACKVSWDEGNDGYLSFMAKTNLIEHYEKTLGAKHIGGQQMVIEPYAASYLISKYLKEDLENEE